MDLDDMELPNWKAVMRKPLPEAHKASLITTYNALPDFEGAGNKLRTSPRAADVLADIFVNLTPLSFIILAVFAYRLDGQPLSEFGDHVQTWALLSPTIFPLVFSAVAGSSLNSFARYRLERGSRLENLEQLTKSQTLFGAMRIHVVLRTFNILGVSLVALWLISPLGSQATLRILSQRDRVILGNTTLAALDMTTQDSSLTAGYAQELAGDSINAIYTGCLVAPMHTKTSSQDSWGNLKIPNYESYNNSFDAEGFASVPRQDVDWVSLLGVPVAGLNPTRKTNFTLAAWYHDVECSDLWKVPATSDWINTIFDGNSSHSPNVNASTIWSLDGGYSSWLLYTPAEQKEGARSRNFNWISKCGKVLEVDNAEVEVNYEETCLANCSMTYTSVQIQLECQGLSCTPVKIKKVPTASALYGPMGGLVTSDTIWSYWSDDLISLQTRSPFYGSSPTEQYIYGHVASPYGHSTGDDVLPGYLNMSTVPLQSFTSRLRTIINTYYMASLAPEASTSALSSANATQVLSGKTPLAGGFFPLAVVPVAATTSFTARSYHCHKGFGAVVILAASALCIIAFSGLVAKYSCRGPDMLGYITSIIRHNPYTPLRPQNTTIDTETAARKFKDLFIRLEDVRGQGKHAVGQIAISSAKMTSLRQTVRQDPQRTYI